MTITPPIPPPLDLMFSFSLLKQPILKWSFDPSWQMLVLLELSLGVK